MIYSSLFDPLPEPPPINVYDFIFHRPDALPIPGDQIAQIDAITGLQRTRAEVLARVNACAREICTPTSEGGLGLADYKDVMVGIYSDNSLDMIVLILALLKSAVRFSLISSHSTQYELTHAISKSACTHMFIEASRLPITKKVCRDKKVNKYLKSHNIFYIEGNGGDRTSVDSLVQSSRERAKDPKNVRLTGGLKEAGMFKSRPVTKDTLAYLVFSSGTSGLPKAVMISHGNLIYSFMQWGSSLQEALKYRVRILQCVFVRILTIASASC